MGTAVSSTFDDQKEVFARIKTSVINEFIERLPITESITAKNEKIRAEFALMSYAAHMVENLQGGILLRTGTEEDLKAQLINIMDSLRGKPIMVVKY
jgi:hypothetical protein